MRIRSFLLLTLLGTPCAAVAQDPRASTDTAGARRARTEFGFDIGHTRYGSDLVRPDGGRFGLLLARSITARWAWTFDITCLGGTPAGAPEEDSFTICTGSLGGQVDLGVTARARPYLRASFGQSQLDLLAEQDVFDIDERGGATTFAVGDRITIGRSGRYALRIELAFVRNDVLGGTATHRSVAIGVSHQWR